MTKSKRQQWQVEMARRNATPEPPVDIVGELKKIKSYSAGIVSGMTDIPQPTLRRYVIQFRRHFSEEAQKNTRGRKFTHKDVEMLVFIKDEFRAKSSIKEIDSKLDGEWKVMQKDRYQPEIIRIGLRLEKLMVEVEAMASKAFDQMQMQMALVEMDEKKIDAWNERLNGMITHYNKHINRRLTRSEWLELFLANQIPC